MSEEIRDGIDVRLQDLSDAASEYRGWFMFSGIALIVLGVLAIFFPFVTTIAAKLMLGWVILIGGIVQAVQAFSNQKWSGLFYELAVGLLFVLTGGWLAFFPLTGIVTLTVLLAVACILAGAVETAFAFKIKPGDNWGWFLFSGIISIVAGFLLIAGLPSTGTWAIGLLVGFSMMSRGWAFLSLALRAGQAQKALQESTG
jgi:uncharacterized membrane protein HdeD (DUF308 family)